MNLDYSIILPKRESPGIGESIGNMVAARREAQQQKYVQDVIRNSPDEESAVSQLKKYDYSTGVALEEKLREKEIFKQKVKTFKEQHRETLLKNKYAELDHVSGIASEFDFGADKDGRPNDPDLPLRWKLFQETAKQYGINVPEFNDPRIKPSVYVKNLIDQTRGLSGKIEEMKASKGAGADLKWKVAKAEWDRISQLPDGPEKDKEIQDYLMWNAASTGYAASPKSIEQAADKSSAVTAARIKTEAELAGTSAKTGGTIAAGKEQGMIDKEFSALPVNIRPTKKISGADADRLALKAQGVAGALRLKNLMVNKNLNWKDLTAFGEFTNPEANQAYQDMVEALARMNTGAAFSGQEDARFQKELGNWKMLTTDDGRRTMVNSIDNFIQRQKGSARVTWGNDGWLENYGVKEVSESTGSKPDVVQNGIIYKWNSQKGIYE